MSYYGFSEYVSVEERRIKAQKAIEKLRKKNPDISPIIIEGRKIAKTWWGMAWNKNLESYADYESRIQRGRSYVRNMAVIDLKIQKGMVIALVKGSPATPYEVKVQIEPVKGEAWDDIKKVCQGKIESLQELIDGKFPKALGELFTSKGTGLFPSPKNIKFACTCPDYASMCKHVAAVLYGIGARLDDDPSLFFTLRNANVEELISQTIQEKKEKLISKTAVKSRRILNDADVMDIFGVEVESSVKKVKGRKKGKKE